MFLPWALCVTAFPLMALATKAGFCTDHSTSLKYASPILESLQCVNDYKSHIRCSLREGAQIPSQALLSLYHRNNVRETACHLVTLPDGHLCCQYNITLFAVGIEDTFFFKQPCPPTVSRNLSLLQHVRVEPPHSLSQQAMAGGGQVLKWQNPYPPESRLPTKLNYQVNYRRLGQEWMEKEVSGMELKIEAESLVPGCRYEAKVRAREEKGLWSEWSPLVEWQTENVSAPGPSNLQCVFNRKTSVNCSWEVTRDLAQFVTYNLCYRTGPNSQPQWCNDSYLIANPGDQVLRFTCSFSVSDPKQQLLVDLMPIYNAKVILSNTHIKPPCPDFVKVTERDQNWVLTWPCQEYPKHSAYFTYEVRYWSDDKQGNMKHYNISCEDCSFVIHGGVLLPSTRYKAKVRVLVTPSSDHLPQDDSYSGPPSEWTDPVEWTTPPAPWPMNTLIYIFIAVLVATVFFGLYVALPACHRRIVLWQVSVPSPLKSKVLEEIMKRSSSSWPALQKEFEKTRICSVQVLEKDHLPCFSEDCSHPMKLTVAFDNAAIEPDGLNHCDSLSMEKQAKDPCLSFSGPYIFCPTCSPPQSCGADSQSCMEGTVFNSSSFTSQLMSPSLSQTNTGYVELPEAKSSLSEGSGQQASQGHDLNENGYVDEPHAVTGHLQLEPVTELSGCAPPADNAGPVAVPTVLLQGAPEGSTLQDPKPLTQDKVYPSTSTAMLAATRKAEGGGERRDISDYVRLSEPFCTP